MQDLLARLACLARPTRAAGCLFPVRVAFVREKTRKHNPERERWKEGQRDIEEKRETERKGRWGLGSRDRTQRAGPGVGTQPLGLSSLIKSLCSLELGWGRQWEHWGWETQAATLLTVSAAS